MLNSQKTILNFFVNLQHPLFVSRWFDEKFKRFTLTCKNANYALSLFLASVEILLKVFIVIAKA